MLYEQELKTFVEGTTNFFEVAAQQAATIGSPPVYAAIVLS